MSDKKYLLVEGFEAQERRYLKSLRRSDYVGLTYWYAEILGVDDGNKWEAGIYDELDARAWLEALERDLKEFKNDDQTTFLQT